MSRTAIIHIGLTKTGTSSIQRVIAAHRDDLLREGVCYPTSPGAPAHSLLVAAARDPGEVTGGLHRRMWQGLRPAQRLVRFQEEFAAEMRSLPATVDRVLLSAEGLSNSPVDEAGIAALRAFLEPHFDDFRIVVYLRRQDLHAASLYGQALRQGRLSPPALPRSRSALEHRNYQALLDRWARVFGEDAILPRIFDRRVLRNGDAVDDFIATCGLRLTVPRDDPGRQANPSLDAAGQALLLALGQAMLAGRPEESLPNSPLWSRIAQAVSQARPGRGWLPSRAAAAAFMRHYERSNEAVRQRWFPGLERLFPADDADLPESEAWPGPEQVLEAACGVIIESATEETRRAANAARTAAQLQLRLGDRAAAREQLLRAVQAEPAHLPSRLRLAALYLEDGDAAMARQQVQAAQEIAPGNPGVAELARRMRLAP